MFKATLQQVAAGAALLIGTTAAAPALADINASATTSGTASSYTLVARITPDAQYLGHGKLYFVMQHGAQLYVLSETRGFIAYTAGEPTEYRTITQATETITVQGWNTSAQAGAAIFVGYGTDVTDMLNNGKFKLVATLPQAPAPVAPPPVTPPPVVSNPYAVYNGSYNCSDEYGRTGTVTASFTAGTATVDTTRLTAIPVNSYSLPLSTLFSEPGFRTYHNTSFPLKISHAERERQRALHPGGGLPGEHVQQRDPVHVRQEIGGRRQAAAASIGRPGPGRAADAPSAAHAPGWAHEDSTSSANSSTPPPCGAAPTWSWAIVPNSTSVRAGEQGHRLRCPRAGRGHQAGDVTFTRYGTVSATVEKVMQDAVNDEKRGAIFPATLKLNQTAIDVDGKQTKLAPGMNITAEIKTGQRRVIEFLLRPIQKAGSEILRER